MQMFIGHLLVITQTANTRNVPALGNEQTQGGTSTQWDNAPKEKGANH